MTGVTIPRLARGPREVYGSGGEEVNKLLAAVTALTAEVAVLRQRVRTLEGLNAAAGVIAGDAVDQHEPSIAEREEQSHWNEGLMKRVFYRYVGSPPPDPR